MWDNITDDHVLKVLKRLGKSCVHTLSSLPKNTFIIVYYFTKYIQNMNFSI